MGTITVALDGDTIFTWQGDEAEVRRVLETFPRGAARVDLTPQELAEHCVTYLSKGLRIEDKEQGPVVQGMQMMGVIWHILEAETHSAENPDKIADYAGTTDFDVDLQRTVKGFTVHVQAHSKFDA
jgi:hypothetical protein